jgi:excisionase family DNA binding protein
MDGRWLSTEETARELRLHPQTVRQMIEAKRLPGYRFGHAYRVDSGELAEFVSKSRVGADVAGTAAGAGDRAESRRAVCG